MTSLVILTKPDEASGTSTIELRAEEVSYDITRNVRFQKMSKSETRLHDHTAPLLNIAIRGIITNTTDLENLITASTEWWIHCKRPTEYAKFATISWRGRTPQYMVIKHLEITDMAETDSHEFTFSLQLAVDTRT